MTRDDEASSVSPTASERGAFVVLSGILMLVLLGFVAFAVDLGRWYGQAADMQSAADAAALAGATEQQRTGDPALVDAEVDRVLRSNGIDTSDPSVAATVAIGATGSVTVDLVDSDVELLFSDVVLDGLTIGRTATAFLDDCGSTCVQTINIPQPFNAVQTVGSGDGWTPVVVGDRIFGVNHHKDPPVDIVCVEVTTSSLCAGYPMAIGTSPSAVDLYTGQVPMGVGIAGRVIFAANTETHFGLGCWDAALDRSCGFHQAAALTRGAFFHNYARGGGTTLVGGMVYAFADDLTVHCIDPSTLASCGGYPRSQNLLAASGHPGLVGGDEGSFRDAITANGRIYHTLVRDSVGTATLACWDTTTDAECASFGGGTGGIALSPTSNMYDGIRLFFKRDAAGTPTGICVRYSSTHDCYGLSGGNQPDVPRLDAELYTPASTLVGSHHTVGSRTYFNGGYVDGVTDCWDWSTSRHCGRLGQQVIGGITTAPYGYDNIGDCIFALGDHSVFWTFDEDMNLGCRSGSADAVIYPCICSDGSANWGQVTVVTDLRSGAGPFEEFDVTVFETADPDNVVLAASLLDTEGVLDLAVIPTTYSSLTVRVFVKAKVGRNPWATGDVTAIEVGWRDQPYLEE